ncbi:MAG: hypothetical protein QOH63_2497 [Acidobacteriota bacterium]|jgi:hypothetical protein|nr:hypothetical protein [Acidobacteriota bacterium]MDT5062038.1 hypothetical protein [Acidobacteriota bacterium]
MSANATSTNPVVQAIVAGTAPQGAKMAAARGLLPLDQADMLEALVALRESDDATIARAAQETLLSQEPETLTSIASSREVAPSVLGYLAARPDIGRAVHEAVTLNARTPDEAIALLAGITSDGALLELITVNQQRLIRAPSIIEAVINNPARTPEAERRVRETRREFFEKERGAQQIAEELRARGQTAAAEFIETAESVSGPEALTIEDAWLIAQHIEVSDVEIDDSWLALERLEELLEESYEQRMANAERVIADARSEGKELLPERISLIRRVMMMTVKDRVKLGLKGDREARAILIRDSNRVVAAAVIHNPRVTDQEIENIASMRTVSDEVLRIISMNRAWARSYPIILNLTRNPRTPVPTAMNILPRIHTKDLQHISQNRNVSEAVRRQAYRLAATRSGH